MNLLVFSDSHRSLSGMYAAIDRHHPHQIIHLGDLMEDAEEVAAHYPKLPFCLVPGNCDGWVSAPIKKQITLEGTSILLSHGHRWGVKSGYGAAIADAQAAGADPVSAAGKRALDDEPWSCPLQLRTDCT